MRQVVISRQAQKVVAVAYMRWSFTRGSKSKALSGKILVLWIGGRLREVVVYDMWSHMEVGLYSKMPSCAQNKLHTLASSMFLSSLIITTSVNKCLKTFLPSFPPSQL